MKYISHQDLYPWPSRYRLECSDHWTMGNLSGEHMVVFKKRLWDLFLLSKCVHSILGKILPLSFSVYINLFFVNCFMCNKVVAVESLHSWVLVFGQMFKQIVSLRWCYTRRFATMIFSATQRCDIVATLFWTVTTLFQHCNAVLR